MKSVHRAVSYTHLAEGIALDVNGYVSEGSGENVFIVHREKLITAPLGNSVLPGITRDSTLQIARDLGIPIAVSYTHLQSASLGPGHPFPPSCPMSPVPNRPPRPSPRPLSAPPRAGAQDELSLIHI